MTPVEWYLCTLRMQQTPGLLTHGLLSAVVWYLYLLQQLGMCVGVNLHVQFIPSLEVIRRRPGRFVHLCPA